MLKKIKSWWRYKKAQKKLKIIQGYSQQAKQDINHLKSLTKNQLIRTVMNLARQLAAIEMEKGKK